VHAHQIGLGHRVGGPAVQVAGKPCHIDQVLEPAFGFGVFRQPDAGGGLHHSADGHHEGVVAAGMPKAPFVPEKTRCHDAPFADRHSMGGSGAAWQSLEGSEFGMWMVCGQVAK
jgi:hypothetical protein